MIKWSEECTYDNDADEDDRSLVLLVGVLATCVGRKREQSSDGDIDIRTDRGQDCSRISAGTTEDSCKQDKPKPKRTKNDSYSPSWGMNTLTLAWRSATISRTASSLLPAPPRLARPLAVGAPTGEAQAKKLTESKKKRYEMMREYCILD